MATAHSADAGFQKWKDGIDKANSEWDSYDPIIREVVGDYNRHLHGTSGFRELDWRIVKAMAWTETGAQNPEWKKRPIQIGVPRDLGLSALLGGNEGGDLIMPAFYRLVGSEVQNFPRENIKAGVGYMLMRMANYGFASVPGRGATVFDVTVRTGDTLERIAKAQGSTVAAMTMLNPGVQTLRPGQTLKCQKASIRKVITGWNTIDHHAIATRYNGGGDSRYAQKLEYAMQAIKSRSK